MKIMDFENDFKYWTENVYNLWKLKSLLNCVLWIFVFNFGLNIFKVCGHWKFFKIMDFENSWNCGLWKKKLTVNFDEHFNKNCWLLKKILNHGIRKFEVVDVGIFFLFVDCEHFF